MMRTVGIVGSGCSWVWLFMSLCLLFGFLSRVSQPSRVSHPPGRPQGSPLLYDESSCQGRICRGDSCGRRGYSAHGDGCKLYPYISFCGYYIRLWVGVRDKTWVLGTSTCGNCWL